MSISKFLLPAILIQFMLFFVSFHNMCFVFCFFLMDITPLLRIFWYPEYIYLKYFLVFYHWFHLEWIHVPNWRVCTLTAWDFFSCAVEFFNFRLSLSKRYFLLLFSFCSYLLSWLTSPVHWFWLPPPQPPPGAKPCNRASGALAHSNAGKTRFQPWAWDRVLLPPRPGGSCKPQPRGVLGTAPTSSECELVSVEEFCELVVKQPLLKIKLYINSSVNKSFKKKR